MRKLEEVEKFLDEEENAFIKKVYPETGYPTGHELRMLVEEMGGDWEMNPEVGYHDTIYIFFKYGVIKIERPMQNIDGARAPYMVRFLGPMEVEANEEQAILGFMKELIRKEHQKSKELFLQHGGIGLTPEEKKEKADRVFGNL